MEATVYAHTVEGLFWRALKPHMTPALKVELNGLGLDLDGKPRDVARTQWVPMLAFDGHQATFLTRWDA